MLLIDSATWRPSHVSEDTHLLVSEQPRRGFGVGLGIVSPWPLEGGYIWEAGGNASGLLRNSGVAPTLEQAKAACEAYIRETEESLYRHR